MKRRCEVCGATEGDPHHDTDYRLIVVLSEHKGTLMCQLCLQGCREAEL